MATKTFVCIVPDCSDGELYARGLCKRHYYYLSQMVRRQLTTWDDLEKRGKAARIGLRGSTNAVMEWALDAKPRRKRA